MIHRGPARQELTSRGQKGVSKRLYVMNKLVGKDGTELHLEGVGACRKPEDIREGEGRQDHRC